MQELLGPQASFAEVAEAMGSLIKAGKIPTIPLPLAIPLAIPLALALALALALTFIKEGKILALPQALSPNPTVTPTPNQAGKIRGWGMCNDNAYGLAASVYASRALGVPAPCVLLLLLLLLLLE